MFHLLKKNIFLVREKSIFFLWKKSIAAKVQVALLLPTLNALLLRRTATEILQSSDWTAHLSLSGAPLTPPWLHSLTHGGRSRCDAASDGRSDRAAGEAAAAAAAAATPHDVARDIEPGGSSKTRRKRPMAPDILAVSRRAGDLRGWDWRSYAHRIWLTLFTAATTDRWAAG